MTPHEQRRRDVDVEAFFALPRWALYLGALAATALAGALGLGVFWAFSRVGFFVLPALFALLAASVALLRRSAAGRGLLWTIGRGHAPRTQLIAQAVLSALFFALALALHLASG